MHVLSYHYLDLQRFFVNKLPKVFLVLQLVQRTDSLQ